MKIIIQANAYTKLDKFVHLVDTEISGMAKSKLDKEKNIIITDFMIFNQEVTETNTLIDDESQAKHLNELMKNNEDTNDWNIWWHSHCDMGVFWSTTDDKTIENTTNQSYLISLVVNKKMEMKARLDIFPKDLSPFKKSSYCKFDINEIEYLISKNELTLKQKKEKEIKQLAKEYDKKYLDIEKKYEDKNNKKIENYCKKEIKLKIKEKVYSKYTPTNYHYGYDQNYNKYNKKYDWYKGYKPKKKWNWIDGITTNLDEMLPNYMDEEDDLFNKQAPIDFLAY